MPHATAVPDPPEPASLVSQRPTNGVRVCGVMLHLMGSGVTDPHANSSSIASNAALLGKLLNLSGLSSLTYRAGFTLNEVMHAKQ